MKRLLVFALMVAQTVPMLAKNASELPDYPLSGTLKLFVSKDQYFSYTDQGGQTASFHCSSGSAGTNCAEGTGVYYNVELSDGRSFHLDKTPWRDYRESPRMWIDMPNPLVMAQDGKRFDGVRIMQTNGENYLCIEAPAARAITDQKTLRQYAKRHDMESCFLAVENK